MRTILIAGTAGIRDHLPQARLDEGKAKHGFSHLEAEDFKFH
jgi:hypothetical protein